MFQDKYFHINTPYYSAWTKYGWNKDDWGLGLEKKKVDKLAKMNQTLYVSYGKKDQLYTINAKKVKEYPVDVLKYGNVKLYIIPKSSLNYCERSQKEIEEKEFMAMGVFG